MNQDGKDDIFEILGDHGLIYTWDKDKKEMWPVDTLYSGSEEILYEAPKIFDIDGDNINDLVYIFKNKSTSTRGIIVNTGQESGIQLIENPITIDLSNDLMDYDVIGFESIEINNKNGKELIVYYGKQIETDDLPDSEIRLYDLNFQTNSSVNVTESYFLHDTNLEITSILKSYVRNDLKLKKLGKLINTEVDYYEELFSGNKSIIENFLEKHELDLDFNILFNYLNPKNRYRQFKPILI